MLQELSALGLRNPWSMLKAARNFVVTVQDPTRSDIRHGINTLIAKALENPDPARLRRFTAEEPQLARLYQRGFDPEVDPDELLSLPDGTLGREYVRFIRDNGIDPLQDSMDLRMPQNILAYAFRRAYKLHDVMHVVLGCDTSVLGEVRIVSFSLGQAREDGEQNAGLALAVLLLHLALKKPHELKEAVALAQEWTRLGSEKKLHIVIPFEDLWDRSVGEVREMVLAA